MTPLVPRDGVVHQSDGPLGEQSTNLRARLVLSFRSCLVTLASSLHLRIFIVSALLFCPQLSRWSFLTCLETRGMRKVCCAGVLDLGTPSDAFYTQFKLFTGLKRIFSSAPATAGSSFQDLPPGCLRSDEYEAANEDHCTLFFETPPLPTASYLAGTPPRRSLSSDADFCSILPPATPSPSQATDAADIWDLDVPVHGGQAGICSGNHSRNIPANNLSSSFQHPSCSIQAAVPPPEVLNELSSSYSTSTVIPDLSTQCPFQSLDPAAHAEYCRSSILAALAMSPEPDSPTAVLQYLPRDDVETDSQCRARRTEYLRKNVLEAFYKPSSEPNPPPNEHDITVSCGSLDNVHSLTPVQPTQVPGIAFAHANPSTPSLPTALVNNSSTNRYSSSRSTCMITFPASSAIASSEPSSPVIAPTPEPSVAARIASGNAVSSSSPLADPNAFVPPMTPHLFPDPHPRSDSLSASFLATFGSCAASGATFFPGSSRRQRERNDGQSTGKNDAWVWCSHLCQCSYDCNPAEPGLQRNDATERDAHVVAAQLHPNCDEFCPCFHLLDARPRRYYPLPDGITPTMPLSLMLVADPTACQPSIASAERQSTWYRIVLDMADARTWLRICRGSRMVYNVTDQYTPAGTMTLLIWEYVSTLLGSLDAKTHLTVL